MKENDKSCQLDLSSPEYSNNLDGDIEMSKDYSYTSFNTSTQFNDIFSKTIDQEDDLERLMTSYEIEIVNHNDDMTQNHLISNNSLIESMMMIDQLDNNVSSINTIINESTSNNFKNIINQNNHLLIRDDDDDDDDDENNNEYGNSNFRELNDDDDEDNNEENDDDQEEDYDEQSQTHITMLHEFV